MRKPVFVSNREQVTRHNLLKSANKQKPFSPKWARQPISKASVECVDVRDGACVRPAIKVFVSIYIILK